MDELERKIFLFCNDIVTFSVIKKNFPEFNENKLKLILTNFEKSGIILKEEDRYLSLPLCYEKIK